MSTTVSAAQPTSLWRSRPFTILLISALFLNIGNKVYEIVLPLIIYEITHHSSVAMTTMRTAELLPNLLFAVFIGVFVDRVNKKRWVLWMIGAQVILLLFLVALYRSNVLWLPFYYLIGFLLMTFNYGYFNAQVSLQKLSVPNQLLTSANARFTFVETSVGIMGPVFSSLLLLMSNKSNGFLITALFYLFCMLLFRRFSVSEPQVSHKDSHFWQELREGWVAFRSNRSLWMISLFSVFFNCSSIVVNTAAIFFAINDLSLTSSMVALVFSVSGVGGLLGSLLMPRLRSRLGLGALYGCSAILSSIGYLGLYLTTHLFALTGSLFLIGFAFSVYVTSVYTFRHEQTPSHLMGRISGITGCLFRVGMPFTMYASGWMMLWWGTSSIFLSSIIWNAVLIVLYVCTPLWKLK
ncbi:MFS transporter [Brevibacillus ruminantium]|uniref:MFS transporter n=1 Tax=Brevibacillus ruminantium TaxID=2950604 RepID=A0ABY4WNK9_9BACL|nr:MFS transporter [Brevibacillus ruminantium]USG67420.1 MFS transporter [Brevibacillus ruminantium]